MKEENSIHKNTMELTIFKAAEELFVEKGYNGTSTTEIAAKAGCNQALVHYYYRTKANLFNIILKSKINYMISIFNYMDNRDLSFIENLTIAIEMHFDALVKDKRLPMFVFNEVRNNSELVDVVRDVFNSNVSVMFRKLEIVLQEEIKAKRIRKVSAFDLVVTISSLNMFVFLAFPVIDYILNLDEKGVNDLIQERKKDIVRTVINSLRP